VEKIRSCPRCVSTNTFCLATEKSHNDWRCLECGHGFKIPNVGKKLMQRATDTRRKARAYTGRSARAS